MWIFVCMSHYVLLQRISLTTHHTPESFTSWFVTLLPFLFPACFPGFPVACIPTASIVPLPLFLKKFSFLSLVHILYHYENIYVHTHIYTLKTRFDNGEKKINFFSLRLVYFLNVHFLQIVILFLPNLNKSILCICTICYVFIQWWACRVVSFSRYKVYRNASCWVRSSVLHWLWVIVVFLHGSSSSSFLFILFLFSFFLFPLFYCLPSSSPSLSSSSFSFHPSPLLFSCHHHLFLYIPLLLLCLLTLLSVKVNKGFSCLRVATCFLYNRHCCWHGISSSFQLYFPAKWKSFTL